MPNANDELIQRFYAAFDRKDGDAMAACYTADAKFDDPVFPGLKGKEPGEMWRMLTSRAADLKIDLREHEADDETGSAHWIATYTFTQTGRPVVNDVRATFRFRDGLIAEHQDDFSFHKWSRQALGAPGLLLGWTPILKGATRKKARAGLDEFMASPAAA
ncbi:MAG TPA: nuclear transport factor 2 family protein [Thermoleophilaceae bacterium]|nr:nuclear transport factor 2 family protein [Thermoleophilaceae bacterium]